MMIGEKGNMGLGEETARFRSPRSHQARDRPPQVQMPQLRNVRLTAPYMHDGSVGTLADVIELYSKGANANPNLDRDIRPLNLSAEEKADVMMFLESLAGATQPLSSLPTASLSFQNAAKFRERRP